MKQSLLLAAFATTLAALPAQAQPFAADLLPAYEVNTIVASMGMRPLGRPAWMRGRYVVAAIDRYGRDVNVVIDARDGQVLAVRPLGRGRFGPPPPGYGPRPGPYDRMDGRGAPPPMGPGAPPVDDDEFFDNDQQQGALPPPSPTARIAPPPRDPAVTGSVTRSSPTVRRDAAPKDATPVPRPRPALARANDPGNKPAASSSQPASVNPSAAKPNDAKPADVSKPAAAPMPGQAEAKAEVTPAASNPTASKPAASKPAASKPAASRPEAGKPASAKPEATKPEATAKSEAPKPEVRVIDLSKPKSAPNPDSKPGEAIRF